MVYEEIGQKPISPDQPAGIDARYEPEFEQLQAEIDKLSSPSAQGKVDWKKAAELSTIILSTKSKDLLAASYLSVALIHTRQIDGMHDGLLVLQGILANFWDELFPKKKRMRGRLAAVDWWIERTQITLENVKFQPVPAKTVADLKTVLGQIDDRLVEVLPDPPLLRPLQKAIDTIPVVREAPVPSPEAEKSTAAVEAAGAPAESPKPTTAVPVETPKKIENVKDAVSEITKTLRRLRELSSNLMRFDFSDPLAYRCRRIAAWTLIDKQPRVKEERTQLSAPPPNVLAGIEEAVSESAWENVARLAEDALPRYSFWIDLNRFTAEALINLGDKHQSAHEAVCRETAAFCLRLPGIETHLFSDGTPFADNATIAWLGQISRQEGGATVSPVTGGAAEDDHIASSIRQAGALAKKRKIADAVKMIHDEMTRCSSMKEKHQWTLGMCRILLEAKKTALALPYMEAILKDIEIHDLAAWEPDLAVKGLKLVLKGYNSLPDKIYKEHSQDALKRIARLDPVEALKLSRARS